ncbi:hypothetical protein [Halopelagius longus]|uniref:Uncharacterized protein n=1 Tax=Halopelagius longus TaxID=1236180 RepID=A0A1H1AXV2_9EURY|nr:hypothetical protein [Halopelagius longus]RDI70557.1 hypothetical protein DWB78_01810 [Halopelagius longus]SDQ44480.1 hypothetical protein SAMN05216278_1540 [Halopelagius longus]
MLPENDTDRQARDPSAEHALSDRSEIEGWADDAGKRPVVAATPGGSMRLDFADEADASRAVDWDTFFTLYDSADVALLVDRRTDSHRFVDDERIPEGRADPRTPGGR